MRQNVANSLTIWDNASSDTATLLGL